MKINQNHNSFTATWTPEISNLDPNLKPLAWKVSDFIKKVVFFIPGYFFEKITRWAIYPASSYFFKKIFSDAIVKNYETDAKKVSLQTPDGVQLSGHFFENGNLDDPSSRVMILFHGNGDFYQTESWTDLLTSLEEINANVSFLCFNPRGIGASTQGTPNATNLLLDAETAYQYVRDHLGISEDRIDLYGHSLGGAQAAQLKALHPNTGGKILLDRTFSNIKIESAHFCEMSGLNFSFVKKIAHFFLKAFDWDFQTDKRLERVKDPVYIFYHTHDEIIPYNCNIAKTVESWDVKPDHFHVYKFNGVYGNHHCGDLSDLEFYQEEPSDLDFAEGNISEGVSGKAFLQRAYDPTIDLNPLEEAAL